MESWENKMLGDKLNSLHGLPAGYSPNLSAKWEIVEAGLPATEKRRIAPLFIRWSVAAAVLLAVGLIWMNAGEKKRNSLVIRQSVIKQKPLRSQPIQLKEFTNHTELSLTSQPSHETAAILNTQKVKPAEELASQQSSKTATIPVREDTNWGSVTSAANVPLSVDSIFPIAVQQTAVAAAVEEKPRPAKKKIYQRDFNDGVLVMDTGFVPASRQHFSIQLKPFSRKTTEDGEATEHRLQLKQIL